MAKNLIIYYSRKGEKLQPALTSMVLRMKEIWQLGRPANAGLYIFGRV